MERIIQISRRSVEYPSFQRITTLVIVLTALLMGIETHAKLVEANQRFFDFLHVLIQAFFIVEILLRMIAYAPDFRGFFREHWNVFDFSVVALSLLPVAGPFALVARLARILRVARLVSKSEELRLIIDTMFRSIPSLFHVALLLGLLFYIYGVTGYHLFHKVDPAHWGSLTQSWMTLFKILTLEGWIEMLENVSQEVEWAWMFFFSFIVVAVFVVINLFIAVVINNLQTVKSLKGSES